MITNYTPLQLTGIMGVIFPQGQWATKDSEIVTIPEGAEMPTPTELESVFTEYQSAQTAVDTRATTRTTLRAQWKAQPTWMRGPYHDKFSAVISLLDDNDKDAALEMIDSIDPTRKITKDAARLKQFNEVKAQFAAAIQGL